MSCDLVDTEKAVMIIFNQAECSDLWLKKTTTGLNKTVMKRQKTKSKTTAQTEAGQVFAVTGK